MHRVFGSFFGYGLTVEEIFLPAFHRLLATDNPFTLECPANCIQHLFWRFKVEPMPLQLKANGIQRLALQLARPLHAQMLATLHLKYPLKLAT